MCVISIYAHTQEQSSPCTAPLGQLMKEMGPGKGLWTTMDLFFQRLHKRDFCILSDMEAAGFQAVPSTT